MDERLSRGVLLLRVPAVGHMGEALAVDGDADEVEEGAIR
jgi:hypothetical protein